MLFLKNKCDLNFEELSTNHPDWIKYKTYIAYNLEYFIRENQKKNYKEIFKIDDHANEYIKVPFKEALSLVS